MNATTDTDTATAICASCYGRKAGHGHFGAYCKPCAELPYGQAASLEPETHAQRVILRAITERPGMNVQQLVGAVGFSMNATQAACADLVHLELIARETPPMGLSRYYLPA